MNDSTKPWLIFAMMAAVVLLQGKKADDDGEQLSKAEQLAYDKGREFLAAMGDITKEVSAMEPNKGVKSIHPKLLPKFDAAMYPINELIDEAVKAGKYEAVMQDLSRGFQRAGAK